jgi:hypothetical protein
MKIQHFGVLSAMWRGMHVTTWHNPVFFHSVYRANASKILKKLSKESVIESGFEALALQSEFSRMTLEEMERKMAQNGKVLGAIHPL